MEMHAEPRRLARPLPPQPEQKNVLNRTLAG